MKKGNVEQILISEHFEKSDFKRVSFPNFKPTTQPISIRLPKCILDLVKEKANELTVPYQSLVKEYIQKGILSNIGHSQDSAR
jgi:predicted DNA binding CopG/RHH family protein